MLYSKKKEEKQLEIVLNSLVVYLMRVPPFLSQIAMMMKYVFEVFLENFKMTQ